MDIRERVALQRQLIEQVRQAAELKRWIPKGNLSMHTIEELAHMLAQIRTGTKPRVFKDVQRGPKPGWQDRRPVTRRQVLTLCKLGVLTGCPQPMEVIRSWTYAQAQAVIWTMWDFYWEMVEEKEGFDVGSTGK